MEERGREEKRREEREQEKEGGWGGGKNNFSTVEPSIIQEADLNGY